MVRVLCGNTDVQEMYIRNQPTAQGAKKLSGSTISIYAGIFLLIITVLTLSYKGPQAVADTTVVASTQQSVAAKDSADKISVDQLTAANAITSLAETTNLPVAGDLREATTTLYIKKQLAQTDAEVISKPQIVQPTTSSERGITTYVTKEGDSIDSIASQFNISAQTLRWANNTTSDAVEAGKELVVPRVNGIVYTVKDGDTVEGLAEKYNVSAERITLYNDLTVDAPLVGGVRIVLPDGDLPENERPGYVAPRAVVPNYSSSSTTGVNYGYARVSAGNRYAPGNCTWYAYERRAQMGRPIGSLWGNAYSWASSARMAGFEVNQTPAPGAVFQTSFGGGGYGHVGIVERVDDQNIYVSDMNYAGYNVVSQRTIPRSALGGYNFIH